jgi:predicted transcriptional regulator
MNPSPSPGDRQPTMVFPVRLPADLVAWLDLIASGEDRSRNYIVSKLLEQARKSTKK